MPTLVQPVELTMVEKLLDHIAPKAPRGPVQPVELLETRDKEPARAAAADAHDLIRMDDLDERPAKLRWREPMLGYVLMLPVSVESA